MKRVVLATTFVAIAGWLTIGFLMERSEGGGRFGRRVNIGSYGWTTNLRTAKEQARKSNKPIMVVLRCVP